MPVFIMLSAFSFFIALLAPTALSANFSEKVSSGFRAEPLSTNQEAEVSEAVQNFAALLQECTEFRAKYGDNSDSILYEADQQDEDGYSTIDLDRRWIRIAQLLLDHVRIDFVSMEDYEKALSDTGTLAEEAWAEINFKDFDRDCSKFRQKVSYFAAHVAINQRSSTACALDIAAYFAAEFPLPIAGPACYHFTKIALKEFKNESFLNLSRRIIKYSTKVKIEPLFYPVETELIQSNFEKLLLRKISSLGNFNTLVDVLLQETVHIQNWMHFLLLATHHYIANFFAIQRKACVSASTASYEKIDVMTAFDNCILLKFHMLLGIAIEHGKDVVDLI